MKGRKPKPVVQHRRAGTFRADRHSPKAVAADGVAPPPPAGLTAGMRQAWRRLVDDLAAQGVLHSADAAMLEAAAVLWARAREARELVAAEGLVCRGDRGWVQHPAVRIERESLVALRQVCEQLGLSPVARARLGVDDATRRGMNELIGTIGPSPRLKAIAGGRRQPPSSS